MMCCVTDAHFGNSSGNFKAGPEQGTILKKLCPKEELCFQALMRDVLRPYVPEYKGHFTSEDDERILFSHSLAYSHAARRHKV
jgi:hypothetical protein